MRTLQSKGRSKYLLLVHLIFVVKYRKNLLLAYGDIVKAKMEEIASRNDFEIDTIEVDQDHIHLLVSYNPKVSVASMVRALKGETTYLLWDKYEPALRSAPPSERKIAVLEKEYVLDTKLFCVFRWQCVARGNPSLYRKSGLRSGSHPAP